MSEPAITEFALCCFVIVIAACPTVDVTVLGWSGRPVIDPVAVFVYVVFAGGVFFICKSIQTVPCTAPPIFVISGKFHVKVPAVAPGNGPVTLPPGIDAGPEEIRVKFPPAGIASLILKPAPFA
jgi:hypothetical protein